MAKSGPPPAHHCACEPASIGPTTPESYHRGPERPLNPMPEPTITSRRHPLVARCRDAAAGHSGEALLEGPHLVADALAARVPLAAIVVAEGAASKPEIQAIVTRARQQGLPVHAVTPAVLDAASPTRTPAGVLALGRLTLHDPDDLLHPAPALLAVAIDVQDPGNVGAIARSSEAAGATGLLALGGTAHPFGWKALRGSMGSALRLPVARQPGTLPALRALKERGVRLVALAARAQATLDEADLSGPLAICAGGEGAGLPPDVVALADMELRIPMHPSVESLNVVVATSLVLFEVARQRRRQP